MSTFFSTRQAARKLGIDVSTLSRHISSGKVPAPRILEIGGKKVHSWTAEEIERVRALLPEIEDGRKTWRKKKAGAAAKKKAGR